MATTRSTLSRGIVISDTSSYSAPQNSKRNPSSSPETAACMSAVAYRCSGAGVNLQIPRRMPILWVYIFTVSPPHPHPAHLSVLQSSTTNVSIAQKLIRLASLPLRPAPPDHKTILSSCVGEAENAPVSHSIKPCPCMRCDVEGPPVFDTTLRDRRGSE